MGTTKPRGKYTTISFPVDFYNTIQEYIKTNRDYTSVAEFAKAAMRIQLEREKAIKREIAEDDFFSKMKGVKINSPYFPNQTGFTQNQREEIAEIVAQVISKLQPKKTTNGNAHGLE